MGTGPPGFEEGFKNLIFYIDFFPGISMTDYILFFQYMCTSHLFFHIHITRFPIPIQRNYGESLVSSNKRQKTHPQQQVV